MQSLLSSESSNGKLKLQSAIEARYPRRFRPNEAELAIRRVEQKTKGRLEWLEGMFNDYFCFDGDYIIARENRRIDYARLCAQIHPALPVAWRLSGLLEKTGGSDLELADIHRVIDATTTNFLPLPKGDAIWADLHVHLGGATETSLNLFSLAISRFDQPSKINLPSHDYDTTISAHLKNWLATYHALFHVLLRSFDDEDGDEFWKQAREKLSIAWISGGSEDPSFQPKAWLSLDHACSGSIEKQLAYLAITYYEKKDIQRAWLFWLTALCLKFRHTSNNEDRDAILAFFNLMHLFRRDMIHDGVGLTRFVRYFNSAIRKSSNCKQREEYGLCQLIEMPQQRVELKVTDWIANEEKAKKFVIQATQRLYPSYHNQAESLQACLQQMHVCIHFLRSNDEAGMDTLRFKKKRGDILTQAKKIDDFLRSASATRVEINGVKTNLPALIRGLDVAGDELATPIEVFAPVIRWLRRGPLRCLEPAYRSAMRRLHLSIHAGEDFNHLLSGLRHVDETVEFCEMGHHDRLGHALALGIRPIDWLLRQQEVFVTVEEHLDNLVWAWSKALTLAGRWPNAEAVVLRLEARIRIYAPLVYTDYRDQLTPDSLHRAWQLRRNCPIKWNQYQENSTLYSELEYWVPDAESFDATEQALPYRLYKNYQMLNSQSVRESKSVVLIQQGDGLPSAQKPLNDWLSATELGFMEALQDHMLELYAKRGLIIEVNPSSNVYISRIEDYHQHPIFRWYPPKDEWLRHGGQFNRFGLRSGVMPVCVNTDDPGIFPTTLSNEFQLLKEAAQTHHGIGFLEAENWADRLRSFGVDLFIQSHSN